MGTVSYGGVRKNYRVDCPGEARKKEKREGNKSR